MRCSDQKWIIGDDRGDNFDEETGMKEIKIE